MARLNNIEEGFSDSSRRFLKIALAFQLLVLMVPWVCAESLPQNSPVQAAGDHPAQADESKRETAPKSGLATGRQVAQASGPQQRSLEELAKELENPLSKTWSLVFQNNLNVQRGDVVDGRPVSNTFLFQPALPISLGKKAVFIARPVLPIVSVPTLDAQSISGINGRQTGFGDMQLLTLLGATTPTGLVYGAGGTFKFPTASDVLLGAGKFQAGPTAALVKIGRRWTYGGSVQHWWSYAGDKARDDTSDTNLGYVIQRTLPKAWAIGMSPTVSVNWKAPAGDRLTFPVGLGVSKMIRIGAMPVRFRFEVQYSVRRPDSYGTEWNFRFQAVPVIRNPFAT